MEAVLEPLIDEPQTATLPPCPRCAGTGWEPVSNQDMSGVRRCRDASHLQELLNKSQVPRTHADSTLENFCTRTPAQSRSRARAEYFVRRFAQSAEGLWIRGPADAGKTHLSVAIMRALMERGHRGLRFYYASDLLRLIDPRGPVADHRQRARVRAEAAMAKLLVLDHLDQAALSRTEMGALNYLIDVRERASLPMLVTTRGRKPDLTRAVGGRAAFAIAALCSKLSLEEAQEDRTSNPTSFNGSLDKLWDTELV